MTQFGSPSMAAQLLQQQTGMPVSTTGGDTHMNGMGGMHPLAMNTFDQTFNNVPQDLWRMPMTLEWDWADMTGLNGYEDGISMNGVLPDFSQGSQGTSGMNMNTMNGRQR
jgi:hypothetical protein